MKDEIKMEIKMYNGVTAVYNRGKNQRARWLCEIGWLLIRLGGWLMYKTRTWTYSITCEKVNSEG